MKFFIGCSEICGQVNFYADELKRQGHNVTTCVLAKNKFYPDHHYDIVAKYWADQVRGKPTDYPIDHEQSILDRVALKLRDRTNLFDKYITNKIYAEHDVFIFLWAGDYLMRNSKDLKVLKQLGKKVVSVLVGSDVRYCYAFQQQYGKNVQLWPEQYKKSLYHYLRVIRNVELYSDLIYSVPDQMGLAIRSYEHFPIPLDFNKYKFHWSDRDIPVVVHAPSAPAIKGTDVIVATLDKLKKEGYQFETRFIQNMKNTELLQLLTESDILVDELVLHGPGVLSFEAMASGMASATCYLESSPAFFEPPICSITYNNIYEKVKQLITNRELRKKLAFEGRDYAEKNNAVELIIKSMLHKLDDPKFEPGYQPNFFREKFRIPDHEVINTATKKLNELVAQKWMPDFESHKQSMQERNLI